MIDILVTYKEAFLSGLSITLKLCILVWVIGIVLGSILGMISAKFNNTIGLLSKITSIVISGIPIIVLLYWFYYPIQQELKIDIPAFNVAVFVFSFVNMIMVADLVSNAIKNLPLKYILSARVSGLSNKTFVTKIQIPLIFKQLIGPVLIVQISMLLNSIYASLINVNDIFRQIQRINAIVYKPIELYSTLAIFFILITVPLTLFAAHLKKKYSIINSEEL
ncbi:MAG: ABC transporter permease subunit [Alphaproteobacteria bacterium]|nr:ABC transporter permease subunit [Alphaproteobacteria bacterium]